MPFYYNFQFFLDYSHSIYLIDVFYNHIKFPQTSFVITFAVIFIFMTVLKEDHFLFHLCNFSLTMVYISFYSNTLLNILPCTIFSISHKYFLMSLLVLFYNFSCFKILYLLPLQFFHFIFYQIIALKLFLRSTTFRMFIAFRLFRFYLVRLYLGKHIFPVKFTVSRQIPSKKNFSTLLNLNCFLFYVYITYITQYILLYFQYSFSVNRNLYCGLY